MIGGILIGIGITALSFVLVWLLKKGNTPSIFTYILIALMLVVLCIEGVLMNVAIKAKNKAGNVTETVKELVMTNLPTEAQDYVISSDQLSNVKLGLKLVFPSVANRIDFDNMAGMSVGSFTDQLCLSVDECLLRQVQKTVWILVITTIVLTVLLFFTIPDGSRGRKASVRGNARNPKATRRPHRPTRRTHR